MKDLCKGYSFICTNLSMCFAFLALVVFISYDATLYNLTLIHMYKWTIFYIV